MHSESTTELSLEREISSTFLEGAQGSLSVTRQVWWLQLCDPRHTKGVLPVIQTTNILLHEELFHWKHIYYPSILCRETWNKEALLIQHGLVSLIPEGQNLPNLGFYP